MAHMLTQSSMTVTGQSGLEPGKCTCYRTKSVRNKGKKVRFADPKTTAASDPTIYEAERKVRFANPLTSIPALSTEEREDLRRNGKLLGSAYNFNRGPVCADLQMHYKNLCDCFYQNPDESENYSEPSTFQFKGPVYSDPEVTPNPTLGRRGSRTSREHGLQFSEEEFEWADSVDRLKLGDY
ncbi:hypothetical protein BU23DRAFT_571335 [Bimuria novae-zelandiae CBS 107.79]|uniref:Uncharacterized protein n=1 Tax=Bimuria novae-zelandiae CBS 107.79 TaxID=1447943 RepID=A0A6A5UYW3_9PLEO|nr:hypothetical protein BU23DRAFT_571335 [Bimuria novae-zelandiae CBS 107.79]